MPELLRRPLKLYFDTSVPNFLFAEDAADKQTVTQSLFHPKTRQQYECYISVVVIREIEKASFEKQKKLMQVLAGFAVLELTKEADMLAEAYVRAKVLPSTSFEDAEHVAIATVNNLDAVVSWNFKHLVNLRRTKLVNLINEEMGYRRIDIISPQEVINYG